MFPSPALLTPRQFLRLTAGLLPACLLLILWLDQPLARFIHQHCAAWQPFFGSFTGAAELIYEATLRARLFKIPALFLGLGISYVVGRWLLKLPQANVFLVLLLVHLASVPTSNVLKGVLNRLRPAALFNPGYPGLGFNYPHHPHTGSFPSAHTATFFSLFLPLVLAFPRLRPLLIVPVLIGLGRLVLDMHYLSDVLFSVWLVVLFTFLASQLARLPAIAGPQAALPQNQRL
ncbi:phosphatase PAP2 family protein [Hymenobacter lucidus]|uniref:Phosphatase PAP2 family protein n=1 Tax=Hymenobacter lucidus TaxID=2880930 RepID=A0ABS8AQ25_9BACT|nr:phosphatase PAP2 family protein [Hymenobacter lucidus]MCB2408312.1 phosphatase PAP2 family protein [Hymenobacter lucidus]